VLVRERVHEVSDQRFDLQERIATQVPLKQKNNAWDAH
jgi:hypothetical protein